MKARDCGREDRAPVGAHSVLLLLVTLVQFPAGVLSDLLPSVQPCGDGKNLDLEPGGSRFDHKLLAPLGRGNNAHSTGLAELLRIRYVWTEHQEGIT